MVASLVLLAISSSLCKFLLARRLVDSSSDQPRQIQYEATYDDA